MAKTISRSAAPRKLRAATPLRKPDVILDFLFDRGLFFIVIENIGDGPALNVKTTFDRPITGLGGTQVVTTLHLFKNIAFLSPHKAITTLLDSSTAYFHRGEPRKIAVKISYEDIAHTVHRIVIRHDLGIYEDLAYVTRPSEQNDTAITHRTTHPKEG